MITNPCPSGACPVQKSESCCSEEKSLTPLIKRIRDVSRIALAMFAAYMAPYTFAVSLALGIACGMAYVGYHLRTENVAPLLGRAKPICAQGYLEALSGMQFGETVSELTTHAFIGAHIHCLPSFFIPFTGLAVGAYVGRNILPIGG